MQKLFAAGLIELAKEIGRITAGLENADQELVITDPIKAGNKQIMEDHAQTFRSLGLQMCAMKSEEIANELDSGMNIGGYRHALQELYG